MSNKNRNLIFISYHSHQQARIGFKILHTWVTLLKRLGQSFSQDNVHVFFLIFEIIMEQVEFKL